MIFSSRFLYFKYFHHLLIQKFIKAYNLIISYDMILRVSSGMNGTNLVLIFCNYLS